MVTGWHEHESEAASSTGGDARLAQDLREFLRARGADLVGFGPVGRMEGAPEIMHPRRYLPDAKSLVSIGLHVNEASCDLIARSVRDGCAPASYHSYQLFTLAIVNPQLDELAFQGARFLEERGHRAYPFPANIPHVLKPSEEYPGGPGDISHKHVAVACGLGEIGWHSMLVTPEFGARQKLTSIITNAPLKADAMPDRRLCDPQECGYQCARACPTDAIPQRAEEKVRLPIGDQAVEYGKITGWRCRWGCSGMLKCAGGYTDIPIPDHEPSPEELLEYKARLDPWQARLRTYGGLLPYCGRCLCVCPVPRGR